jgi:outer membrane immunogenic protein
MRKILFATVALTALTAPALAADLPVKARVKAPLAVPVYSWTGCYLGGHAGGVWVRKEWFDAQFDSATLGLSDGGHDPSGFLGGFQGGCDYQVAGGFVIGIAGDYAWTDSDATSNSLLFIGQTNHSRVKSLASITGRVGYAWDRFLGYVKGGGAWERDEYEWIDPLGCACTGTASHSRSGWTVGIGGEYAFTNWLTGFVEYNYYDFGRDDVVFAQDIGGTYTYRIDETKSVVKVGLNWRFGGAVVAKY